MNINITIMWVCKNGLYNVISPLLMKSWISKSQRCEFSKMHFITSIVHYWRSYEHQNSKDVSFKKFHFFTLIVHYRRSYTHPCHKMWVSKNAVYNVVCPLLTKLRTPTSQNVSYHTNKKKNSSDGPVVGVHSIPKTKNI